MFRRIAVFLLLSLGCWCSLRAQESPWAAYNEKIKIGFELELPPARLQYLYPYVDLDKSELRAKMIQRASDTVLNDYLELDPFLVFSFPEEVRDALTEGLRLERPQLIRVGDSAPNSAPHYVQLGAVLLRPEDEIELLKKRWRALPRKEKEKLVKLENFRIRTQVEMFVGVFPQREELPLVFKESTPADLKALFERLSWWGDLESIVELTPRVPYQSVDEFIQDRDAVLAAVKYRDSLHNGEASIRSDVISYHYHVSLPGSDLSSRANAINRLLVVKALREGYSPSRLFSDSWSSPVLVAFKGERDKGLLRLFESGDRIEFRFHPENPDIDLEKYLRWLSMDESQALEEIYFEIKQLLHPDDFLSIYRNYPVLVRDFFDRETIRDRPTLEDIQTALLICCEKSLLFTSIYPKPEDLRTNEERDEEIFWLFYDWAPGHLKEYFTVAEMKSRLNREHVESIAQHSPRALQGVYTIDDLLKTGAASVVDSLVAIPKKATAVFEEPEILQYIESSGLPALMASNPSALHIYYPNQGELLKRLSPENLEYIFRRSPKFGSRFFESGHAPYSAEEYWKELGEKYSELALDLFKQMLAQRGEGFAAWVRLLDRAMVAHREDPELVEILRSIRTVMLKNSFSRQSPDAVSPADISFLAEQVGRWPTVTRWEFLRQGPRSYQFYLDYTLQHGSRRDLEQILESKWIQGSDAATREDLTIRIQSAISLREASTSCSSHIAGLANPTPASFEGEEPRRP